jgi:predicted GH43/DUF377 family glycosyl hydrolase
MVAHWLEMYYPPPRSIGSLDDLGIFDYSADSVVLVNEKIPLEYDCSVIPKDHVEKYGEDDARKTFIEARDFLTHAGKYKLGIGGSY